MIRGHRLQEVVDAGLAPSVDWLNKRLRRSEIPGHKIGRHWVMTDDDIEAYLQLKANDTPQAKAPTPLSLTATSLRRQKAS